ncbi:hypothetical protein ACFX2G_044683 [Malus domestica]
MSFKSCLPSPTNQLPLTLRFLPTSVGWNEIAIWKKDWTAEEIKLEDQVANLLQRYLGNYVRGLNKEALENSVAR